MLNDVLGVLHEKGWFDTSRPFEYSVNLTGACIWLLLTREGRGICHVKFSTLHSLARTASRSEIASRRYPEYAPPFVGYTQERDIEILACRAVDSVGMTPRELLRSRRGALLLTQLHPFFGAMNAATPAGVPLALANRQLAGQLSGFFGGGPLALQTRRWLSGELMRAASQLPDILQHGDFVLNNIGSRAAGAPAIFDWEDLGESGLPGLDLFTFELSLAEDPARLPAMRQAESKALRSLKQHACRSAGLSISDYHALTPIYALVFRYLKREYGPAVHDRIDRLLLGLG